jgi:hypothetical protein
LLVDYEIRGLPPQGVRISADLLVDCEIRSLTPREWGGVGIFADLLVDSEIRSLPPRPGGGIFCRPAIIVKFAVYHLGGWVDFYRFAGTLRSSRSTTMGPWGGEICW